MKRKLFFGMAFILICSLLGLLVVLATGKSVSKGRVVVENKTGELIAEVEIRVCRNNVKFWNLPPKSAVGFTYQVNGESGYNLSVTLKSGKKFEGSVGYVTRGFDYADKIIILPGRLELGQRQVEAP